MNITVTGPENDKNVTYVGLEDEKFSAYALLHLDRKKLLRAAEAAVGFAMLLQGKRGLKKRVAASRKRTKKIEKTRSVAARMKF